MAGAVVAIALAIGARYWPMALLPAVVIAVSSICVLFVITRPPVEIHDSHLQAGRRVIPWESVSHVDEPRCLAPLVLPLILNSERRYTLLYPGGREAGRKLLHQIRRHSRYALINGLPFRQYWNEDLESFRDRCILTDQHWHVLSPEDEEDVEQMFHTLRSDGTLHPKNSEEQSS